MAGLGILALLTLETLTTSCSNSDDNEGFEQPAPGTIDPAVGTYKGRLYTSPSNAGADDVHEWFDAVVIVTKEGDNKLKVVPKSGEPYSYVTPKTFTVETGAFFGENTQDIVSFVGSLEGIFHYYGSNQNIYVSTDEQSATDVYFDFEGAKQ